ncbi:hypothetical protein PVAP13_8KG262829 [Panicum virgatum]|uniref:Uncharacterized protein n=1 Tax=Panicum virgatum TaxID=38727 RepID=A0A8T0PVB0_PANVG|nr:hypothetical protein PVAP13_8KG262829 [Panicum virgatum]KAG2562862.1 hypothetical protein PVAP13_8KG262829 [Panicum virgatum]KAG2562866.1 hypothetical protein PVAP13_8KG262829 [Panicum virgatum]
MHLLGTAGSRQWPWTGLSWPHLPRRRSGPQRWPSPTLSSSSTAAATLCFEFRRRNDNLPHLSYRVLLFLAWVAAILPIVGRLLALAAARGRGPPCGRASSHRVAEARAARHLRPAPSHWPLRGEGSRAATGQEIKIKRTMIADTTDASRLLPTYHLESRLREEREQRNRFMLV